MHAQLRLKAAAARRPLARALDALEQRSERTPARGGGEGGGGGEADGGILVVEEVGERELHHLVEQRP